MVSKALMKMKKGKTVGPAGLNVEMIVVGDTDIILAITYLINCVVAKGKIPNN